MNKKFIILSILVLAVSISWFSYSFIVPRAIIFFTINGIYQRPELSILPQTREIKRTDITMENLTTVTHSDLTLQIPYEIINSIERAGIKRLELRNNRKITLNPVITKDEGIAAAFQRESDPETRRKMEKIFSRESLSSNYMFIKIVMESSSQQLNWFSPLKKLTAGMILMPLKMLLIVGSTGDIYEFSINGLKGFQVGTPQPDRSSNIRLMIFDPQDRQFDIIFSNGNFTQAEIDFILTSLKIKNSDSDNYLP